LEESQAASSGSVTKFKSPRYPISLKRESWDSDDEEAEVDDDSKKQRGSDAMDQTPTV
jgi:hypothetical protein